MARPRAEVLPQQVGDAAFTSFGEIRDAILEGNTVYFATTAGVESVNISNPTFPVSSGYYNSVGGASTITRNGGVTYTGSGQGLLLLQDVTIQPKLTITSDGSNFTLMWSPEGGGFELQWRPAPGEGSWETIETFGQGFSDWLFQEPRRIFRLRRQ